MTVVTTERDSMNTMVVGLTGGIASGKSTVDGMFEDIGIPVICLDKLAHEVVKPGSPALVEIRELFGDRVIAEDGSLDRAAVAELVFQDEKRRKELEAVIHPKVAEEKNRRTLEYFRQGHPIVIVDVPLLYEVKWEKSCDCVIVVYVPRETQEERLTQRDGMSEDEVKKRLDAQFPIEEKRKRADYVIENTGTLDDTRRQVSECAEKLRHKLQAAAN